MRLLLAVVIVGLTGVTPVIAAEKTTVDGVTHIRNGDTPTQGVETWKLEELWRAGGEDDEENMFGLVSQVVGGDDGTIYVLDTQLSEVAVFSADGERAGTLSREGEGPGETRMPADMLFMPDGSLGLVQIFPGKITMIALDDTPVGVVQGGGSDPTLGGFVQFFDVKSRGDELVIGGVKITRDENLRTQTHFVSSFNLEGVEKTQYAEHPTIIDFQNPSIDEGEQYSFDFRHWALDGDGRVYVAPARNDYELHVYDIDGSLLHIIERDYDSYRRTSDEVASVKARIEGQIRAPIEIPVTVEDTEPDISAVYAGPDGNIWVDTSLGVRNQADGILKTWDVFDTNGDFVKQVAIECEGDGEEDMLVFASSERAIVVTGFASALRMLQGNGGAEEDAEEEAAPMEIICYAVNGG